MVSIKSEDERFEELAALFSAYWEEASVLNSEAVAKYEQIYSKAKQISKIRFDADEEVLSKLGKVVFSNIERGKTQKTKENIFIDTYSKAYQETVTAFNRIRELYLAAGRRKVSESIIPLRLEIDSFFSFVRDVYATHEKWLETPIGWNDSQKLHVTQLIDEWLDTRWPHFEETIAHENYPLIRRILNSPASIEAASMDEIVDALWEQGY